MLHAKTSSAKKDEEITAIGLGEVAEETWLTQIAIMRRAHQSGIDLAGVIAGVSELLDVPRPHEQLLLMRRLRVPASCLRLRAGVVNMCMRGMIRAAEEKEEIGADLDGSASGLHVVHDLR